MKTFVERQVGTSALQRVNYSYDTVDQLTLERSTEATPQVNNAFAYDTRGNRTASSSTADSTSYVPNALNQVTSYTNTTGTANLSYDADGNLTQSVKGAGGSTYSYDEENRLTRITGVNQTTGVNEKKSEFFYDGQSRKAVSREFTWNAGTSAWVQQYEIRRVYDGMDVVQERDGSNAVTANYTRSGNIGGLLARSTSAGHFYYHYDGSGNVMQLTDANQAIVAEYSYDAYGVLQSASGLQSGQPYRFSTKEYHSDSGLYDYGYRFYSPGLGRWINRDPLEEEGGLNLYGFVENDPVNLVDTNGLYPVDGKPDPNTDGPFKPKPSKPKPRPIAKIFVGDTSVDQGQSVVDDAVKRDVKQLTDRFENLGYEVKVDWATSYKDLGDSMKNPRLEAAAFIGHNGAHGMIATVKPDGSRDTTVSYKDFRKWLGKRRLDMAVLHVCSSNHDPRLRESMIGGNGTWEGCDQAWDPIGGREVPWP